MTNTMQTIINDTVDILTKFSPDLAEMFRTQPFNRVDIAVAFAAGFIRNETDDPHPTAVAVMEVAFLDRKMRRVS